MWTKATLLLGLMGILSPAIWAEPTDILKIGQFKQQWKQEQQLAEKHLQHQRENFLQLESLLQTAERQGRVTPTVLKLAEQLYDSTYPLNMESEWAILKAKLARVEAKNKRMYQL